MGFRSGSDPSPIRTGVVHAGLSLLAFGGLAGMFGAGVHLTGNPAEASPEATLALFDSSTGEAPYLKNRLRTETGIQVADNVPARSELPDTAEPSLGVADPGGARATPRIATATIAAPQGQGSAANPDAIPEGSVRINGKWVAPGESLSSVTRVTTLPKAKDTSHGLTEYKGGLKLPRVSDDGKMPADVYAHPFTNPRGQPTVSLVLGGLGINATHTRSAIEELPPEVTLSFAPDARNLQVWINRARAAGHEVMLEVPMQPFEYGRIKPHALTLAVQNNEAANTTRLEKLLSRANGYFGVINYQGAKFATDEAKSTAALEVLSARGIAFVEDGSLRRSVFGKVAADTNLRFARASRPVDLKREADDINTQLAELETLALEGSVALGTAYAYPVTIDTVKAWTDRLEDKGILLAPASSLTVTPPAGSFRTGSSAKAGVDKRG